MQGVVESAVRFCVSRVSVISRYTCTSVPHTRTRRIILQKIPIDVRVLCAFLDRLCNFTIFARRLSWAKFSLHNLTLPRSWILASLDNLELLRDKDFRGLGYGVVDLVSVLLKQLHTQVEAGEPRSALWYMPETYASRTHRLSLLQLPIYQGH